MRKYILIVAICTMTVPIKASSVLASSFGWTGVDDTQVLMDAFTADADTVIVDMQPGLWISGPLIFDGNVNDKVIIFEYRLLLSSLYGAFDSFPYNGLFTFINCNNVSLIGYGATLRMDKDEYIALNDGSEWRHVISLAGCSNFKIFGLELANSGGDGIEISGLWQQPVPSTNIHIKDCIISDNYRQGISVTSARDVLIENCNINGTSGTPPAFGIDLEPDNPYDEISNIQIKNCRITGNMGGGILISLWQLDETSPFVSVNVSDSYIRSNGGAGIVVDVNSTGPVEGLVTFERCIVAYQPENAIFSNKRESLELVFSDMIIRDTGRRNHEFDMPIFIQSQYDYSGFPLGNISFQNIFIDDGNYNRNFMNINHWGSATQVENITADFFVYNPNGVSYHIDEPLMDVNITVQELPSLPVAEVSIFSDDEFAYEYGPDSTASFTVSRTATDYSFPLGVYFTVDGDAENGLDYPYFTQALVIPADHEEGTYSIIALEDGMNEHTETIDVILEADDHYSISNGDVQLIIDDVVLGVNDPLNISFNIYPNPVMNNLIIQNEHFEFNRIRIYNLLGQVMITDHAVGSKNIDVSDLSAGVYFLEVTTGRERSLVKFMKTK